LKVMRTVAGVNAEEACDGGRRLRLARQRMTGKQDEGYGDPMEVGHKRAAPPAAKDCDAMVVSRFSPEDGCCARAGAEAVA